MDARLQEAQKVYDEAMTLYKAGKYPEAVAQGERALALREAALGGKHPGVADCLALLGIIHWTQGDFVQAEPLIQRGLEIREEVLGKNHPDVASSLNNLANLYMQKGLLDQAASLHERALTIRETALGKNHPSVAGSLNNLSNVYRAQGLFDRAEPLIRRSLAIKEASLGKNHPDVASSLNNLANLYLQQGLYAQAEPLYQRALAIREVAHGKDHPEVASALNNLANLYVKRGLYDRAEPLYLRALTLYEVAFDKHHPYVAQTLLYLATLYSDRGLYGRAEPLYLRAIAINEAALGKSHSTVANSIHNLANLYQHQGLYDRAEPLYLRAIAIEEELRGKDHPTVAIYLTSLSSLYQDQGLYDRVEPLQQRALAIKEASFGKDHPEFATSLANLADVYRAQRLYDRAEPLYLRALAIREAVFGKQHPFVADVLHPLANLYQEQGLLGRAEPLHQRALALRESILGKKHPDVATSLNDLALLRLAQDRLGVAVPLFTRAFAVSEQRLRHEALDFSEARLATFLQHLRADEERIYALLRAHPDNASVRRLALSAALLLKGRSVEETAGISRAVYRSLGSEDRDTFERLRGLRTQRAMLALKGPGQGPPTVYAQLKELAEQGDALEADLARRSAPLRALTALPAPAKVMDDVARALPKDGALIELISYLDQPLVPNPGTPEAQQPRQQRYLALALFPDATLRALDLGPAEPIDSAASSLRDALANRDITFQAKAQALYQLAFQPLLPLLGRTRRLFLSPDGQLALVPFAALHDGKQFLVESFDFTYLTSGKDLLPRSQETPPATSVVVLADPAFGAPAQGPAYATAEALAPAERSASLERFFSTPREDLVHRAWNVVPLPGTRQEAEAIQHLLPQAQLFLGPEATKERLMSLPSPGILHLATHGFFLQDAPVVPGTRAVVHFGAMGEDSAASRPPDPLLRSGLILAGARPSTPGASSSPQPPPENALVTALELAGLDLWGTQLVVLSACDTGRGDVKLGQGVYGLRRALVVAGAETVVMSLWKVSDDTTQQLMEAYYRNLLAGQGRATALREAMRWLRATRPEPHSWAPFIVLGRDRPLRGLAAPPPGTPAP
ncbi:hypothetical protein DB31_1031 [Hyalangium minutum]|uniref:CHAT domain-containing protein n=1 Tax=Hyalangium minutum TaxID=394096 RepID=A0A085WFU5_9BACT|nr:hypothetical protein DB31_1031 [Hyalangium minutum]